MEFLKNISFGDFYWVELLYAMIGSFVGIFVPLWIEKSKNHKQQKEARRRLVASITPELELIKSQIEEFGKDEHKYEIFSFSTFAWDSVISSGSLLDMYSDEDIQCGLLMEIYSSLSALKELHDDFCVCDDRELAELLFADIQKRRDHIKEKIDQYQNDNKVH